jgi:hypothetical protein
MSLHDIEKKEITMENAPIGHNNPPVEELAVELELRLKRQYPELASEWAELEEASFSLPRPEDIDDDAKAMVVQNFIKNLKAYAKKVSSCHEKEKAEFLVLGRKVDSFFNVGYKKPCEERVIESEKILKPFLLAKAEAEAARRLEEEERRKAIEAERLRREEEIAEAARKAEAEAAEAARKIREAENEEARKIAEAEMRQVTAAAEEAREEAHAELQQSIEQEKQIVAISKVAAKTAFKGSKIIIKYSVQSIDWIKLRATLGPLEPYLIDSVLEGALSKAAREGTAENPPPTINGVVWGKSEDVRTTARKAKDDE